jgi:hypothetical protein
MKRSLVGFGGLLLISLRICLDWDVALVFERRRPALLLVCIRGREDTRINLNSG